LSIVATETSTVTFLSVPGMVYARPGNMTFLQLAFGYILGRYATVYLLLPLYFRGELYTAYQVLHQRFGGATKQVASLLFIVTRSLADGLRLYLTALVVQKMTGLDMNLAVLITGAATILYTYFGGMKAVIWTDVIQFFIYTAGAVMAGAIILRQLPGGWSDVLEYGRLHGSFQVINLGGDSLADTLKNPYVLWAGVLGGALFSLGSHGADQMMVQRYLSARSQRDAGLALGLSGWVVLAQFTMFLLLGVGLAAFYSAFPPERPFDKGDEVFAQFIVDHLPVGVTGITLAAVFSAAMSTLSSSLNSSATAAVNDLYVPLLRPGASDRHAVAVTLAMTVLFGLVQVGVGIGGQRLQRSVVDGRGPGRHDLHLVLHRTGLALVRARRFAGHAGCRRRARRALASLAGRRGAVMIQIGLEACLEDPPDVLRGARFGLLMNQASVDAQRVPSARIATPSKPEPVP
jgi:SSS family transporter